MSMTDPIADMLTRIRNANMVMHKTVSFPSSKIKLNILDIMKDEGFIKEYKLDESTVQGEITVTLKYNEDQRVIKGLKRISKPGLKVYVQSTEVPKVYNGLGVAIISTSQGLMTDREARKVQIGGEVIAYIW